MILPQISLKENAWHWACSTGHWGFTHSRRKFSNCWFSLNNPHLCPWEYLNLWKSCSHWHVSMHCRKLRDRSSAPLLCFFSLLCHWDLGQGCSFCECFWVIVAKVWSTVITVVLQAARKESLMLFPPKYTQSPGWSWSGCGTGRVPCLSGCPQLVIWASFPCLLRRDQKQLRLHLFV